MHRTCDAETDVSVYRNERYLRTLSLFSRLFSFVAYGSTISIDAISQPASQPTATVATAATTGYTVSDHASSSVTSDGEKKGAERKRRRVEERTEERAKSRENRECEMYRHMPVLVLWRF